MLTAVYSLVQPYADVCILYVWLVYLFVTPDNFSKEELEEILPQVNSRCLGARCMPSRLICNMPLVWYEVWILTMWTSPDRALMTIYINHIRHTVARYLYISYIYQVYKVYNIYMYVLMPCDDTANKGGAVAVRSIHTYAGCHINRTNR